MDIWILRVTTYQSWVVFGVFVLGDVVEGAGVVAGVSPVSVGVVKIQEGVMWLLVFNKMLLLN